MIKNPATCGHYLLKMDQTIWCEDCGKEWSCDETSMLLFLNLQRLQWRVNDLETTMENELHKRNEDDLK